MSGKLRFRFMSLATLALVAQFAAAEPLRVRVTGLRSDDGTVHVALFDSEQAFADRKPLREADVPIKDGEAKWVADDLPPGRYAIRAYHDENGNRSLDRTGIGIPDEPVGYSNNARSKFGPPRYDDIAFSNEGGSDEVVIRTERVVSPGGQFGAGFAVVYSESPYKGADSYQVWPFPSLTYFGKRFFIFGPRMGYILGGTDPWTLSAIGQVRFRALDPEDSDFLEGMDKRDPTFEAGLRLRWNGPKRIDVSVSASTDVLDQHNGQDFSFDINRGFRFEQWVVSPSFQVLWQSRNLSYYYYGVSSKEARPDRPEYDPGATWTYGPGVSVTCQALDPWTIIASVGLEFLGPGITDSPVVDQHTLVRGFFGISRQFGGPKGP